MSAYYIIEASYKGNSTDTDRSIRKAARKTEDGAGYLFQGGVRDITWSYNIKRYAVAFYRRLKDAKLKGVRVTLRKFED